MTGLDLNQIRKEQGDLLRSRSTEIINIMYGF